VYVSTVTWSRLMPQYTVSIVKCNIELCVLHSFPTRRSSDLFKNSPMLEAMSFLLCLSMDCRSSYAILEKQSNTVCRSCSDRCRADRKSTRLNSSHVSISYAVFCLKKKKKVRKRQSGTNTRLT